MLFDGTHRHTTRDGDWERDSQSTLAANPKIPFYILKKRQAFSWIINAEQHWIGCQAGKRASWLGSAWRAVPMDMLMAKLGLIQLLVANDSRMGCASLSPCGWQPYIIRVVLSSCQGCLHTACRLMLVGILSQNRKWAPRHPLPRLTFC